MKTSKLRVLSGLLGMLVALTPWLVVPPAHAEGMTYIWTADADNPHVDHTNWGTATNWTPEGHPGEGDTVIIGSIPSLSTTTILGLQDAHVANLTIDSDPSSPVRLGGDGGSITVDGVLLWSGGRIASDLDLVGTGAVIPAANADVTRDLWADLTVHGMLRLNATSLAMSWTHQIVVPPGGTFVGRGDARITTDRCCSAANVLRNNGSMIVDGDLRLDGMELRQQGSLEVTDGSTLTSSKGIGRLGPDASFHGSGTLAFDHTASPDPDPEHPDVQQGALLASGSNSFADGFHLALGPGSILTGTSTFSGEGSMTWDDALVYAELALGKDMRTQVVGQDPSRLGIWDIDRPGYHARVTTDGEAVVSPGSTLSVDDRAQLSVGRGGSLLLPDGSEVSSRTCCADSPSLLMQPGSTLTLGSLLSRPVRLTQVHTELRGTTKVMTGTDVQVTGGTLEQRGGTTRLSLRSSLTPDGTDYLLTSGTLAGVGRVGGRVVNSGGTLSPGLTHKPSVLTIDSYEQGGRGTLRLDLKKDKGDSVQVTGGATLDGRLVARGKRGKKGHRVPVLTTTHRTGRFSHVKAEHRHVRYTGRGVFLVC